MTRPLLEEDRGFGRVRRAGLIPSEGDGTPVRRANRLTVVTDFFRTREMTKKYTEKYTGSPIVNIRRRKNK